MLEWLVERYIRRSTSCTLVCCPLYYCVPDRVPPQGTPHTYHYPNAMGAIEAGKHVLCEKPVTCNAAQLRSLLAAAKAQDVFVMEAMWTRFQPLSLEVKRLIDEGSLGMPVTVHADFSENFDIESKYIATIARISLTSSKPPDIPLTHRILDPKLGGGGLLDLYVT